MLGNVVIWKPAETQIYSAQVIMEIFQAAGLPDGVINMVTVSGKEISKVVLVSITSLISKNEKKVDKKIKKIEV